MTAVVVVGFVAATFVTAVFAAAVFAKVRSSRGFFGAGVLAFVGVFFTVGAERVAVRAAFFAAIFFTWFFDDLLEGLLDGAQRGVPSQRSDEHIDCVLFRA